MIYLFDVDGTLTPSRQHIDKKFKRFLIDFAKNNTIGFVTGSDKAKTIEQLGYDLFEAAHYSFNNLGCVVSKHGQIIHQSSWDPPNTLIDFLNDHLIHSLYNKRFGNHIENRIGMINFSVVGRNASVQERELYYQWDSINKEREALASFINANWSNITATIGGEISIDIYPFGNDKSQILPWLTEYSNIIFIGDQMSENGNDYSLMQAILEKNIGQCYPVSDWKETENLLRKI